MKSLVFVAALMMGSAAVAQMAPPPPADAGTMSAPAEPDSTMAPPPAAPPQGATMAPMAAPAAPAPQASYPRCSRTVTDGCTQSSARESDTKGGKPAHHRRHK
ncbi:hypothetical protein [Sphingomonas paeninsulae]|uniref:hypothetical protein n=1 Tax=Sphingomonas paeninsulae TaxID=2319844 RepID=UPI0013CEF7C2|nr:hypothetical protein [Sphingomonas paeninsulae]